MTDPRARSRRHTAEPPALTARDLVAATHGRLLVGADRPISGAAVDSRAVRPGNLFVALPGEHTDGHRFLAAAVGAGAAALIVARGPDDPDVAAAIAAAADGASGGPVTIVQVADAQRALEDVAASWRTRFAPLVVGVTGSVAKTSTKEAIATVLERRLVTLRNEGNLNNEIGLPLTLLRLGPEHEAAVLEMGMYVGGEIAQLAAIARPAIGVVTAVAGVHLSRIGTIDAVERAKGELVEALPPAAEGGVAVLNADDERVSRMDARTQAAVVRYGFGPAADVRAEAVRSLGRDGMGFELVAGNERRPVRAPVLGRHSVANGLAAAAVGLAAGLSIDDVATGLESGWSAPHRGELVDAAGVLIVDDTYNASPRSMAAALQTLAGLPGRHVAVLGQMLELGDAQEAGHLEVGEAAAPVVDLLVVVGAEAAGIAEGARAAGRVDGVVQVHDREAALELLRRELRPGDVVLFKASRGLGLNEAEKSVRGLGLEVLLEDVVGSLRGGAR